MIDIIFILVRYLYLQDIIDMYIYYRIKLKVDFISNINRTGSKKLIL